MTSVSGYSLAALFNPAQVSNQLISNGDQNGDSTLSFSEFSSIGTDTSSSTATDSSASQRMTDLFNAIDTDSDGALTKSELTEFGQKLSDAMTAVMLQVQEQSASGDTGQSSTGSGSSQSGTYDSLDTNKDGVVSIMERLAATQSNQANSDTSSQFKSTKALDSYQTTSSLTLSSATSALTLSA